MVEHAEFGPFRFELTPGTLSRDGIPVRLQPQPARVLAILVSRAGEVVSRDELRQQIRQDCRLANCLVVAVGPALRVRESGAFDSLRA